MTVFLNQVMMKILSYLYTNLQIFSSLTIGKKSLLYTCGSDVGSVRRIQHRPAFLVQECWMNVLAA